MQFFLFLTFKFFCLGLKGLIHRFIGFNAGLIAEIADCPLVFLGPPGPLDVFVGMLGNRHDPARAPVMAHAFTDPTQMRHQFFNYFTYYFLNPLNTRR